MATGSAELDSTPLVLLYTKLSKEIGQNMNRKQNYHPKA